MSAAVDVGTPLKRCLHCSKEKPATSEYFELHKQCRGGITSRCKSCCNARAKKWRRDNSAFLARRWKERYAPGHKAAARKLDRHYREHQPEISRSFHMHSGVLARVRAKAIPFDREYLTRLRILEMLLAAPTCPACGGRFEYPSPYRDDAGHIHTDRSPSIDKIIPALGYVRGNVAIICWRCNALKRDALLPELEKLVVWLRRVTSQ